MDIIVDSILSVVSYFALKVFMDGKCDVRHSFLMCLFSTFAREIGKHFEDDDSKIAKRFNDQLHGLTSVEKRSFDCDKGWHKESVFCYRILQIEATWHNAHDHCKEFGRNSDLVDIRSPEEQDFVEWFLRHNNVHMPIWTGGEKIKGQWIWSSDNSPLKYTNWARYEPKRGDYVALNLSFQWFSDYAESQFFCMCKKALY